MIEFVIGSPPAVRDPVLAREVVIPFRARQIIVAHHILVLADNRHQHPPTPGLATAIEYHLVERTGNGDAVLTISLLVFKSVILLAVQKALHEIPYYVAD